MKKPILFALWAVCSITLFAACVSEGASAAYPEDSLTLDAAIRDTAAYFTGRIPRDTKIAITGVEADRESLSSYISEELWSHFEKSGGYIMVDRRNLNAIRRELFYQMSGEVSDESLVSIGKQYGPQTIIYGQFSKLGSEYRLVMYGTDVEHAASAMHVVTVRSDSRLENLLQAESGGRTWLDEEVGKAVAALGRDLAGQTTIAVGRISRAGTQTVTSLSDYLKDAVTQSAARHRNRFLVASEEQTAEFTAAMRGFTAPAQDAAVIQALVTGSFFPLAGDAEVTLNLVSTAAGRAVLGVAKFIIPAAEMEKRELSMLPVLPEKNAGVIPAAEFEAKQEAIMPYAGADNGFEFTVTPDNLSGIYYDGDDMSMSVYSARECWFKITHVDKHGNTSVLYPSRPRDDNRIMAGQTRRIPERTRYRMHAPYGEEYILVAAYAAPFAFQSFAEEPVSREAIRRSLYENDSRPIVTAWFSYTIMPKR